MTRTILGSLLSVVLLAGSGCSGSDDDTDDTTNGNGGKAGSAGSSAGAGGSKAGSAGSSAGQSGSSGSGQSGSAGSGGSAGQAGQGGSAGQAGSAGSAGSAGQAGQGGAGQAGAGGEGQGGSAGGGQGGSAGGAGEGGASGAGAGGGAGQGGSVPSVPEDPSKGAWSKDFGLPGLTGAGAQARSMVRSASGDVYVGGVFQWVDGVAVKNVARWDGKAWHAVGEGLPFTVKAMVFDEAGVLYAGGGFPGEAEQPLARLEGGVWKSVEGLGGFVEALAAAPGGGVFVGGELGKVGASDEPQMVARYDGNAWTAMASASKDSGGSVKTILAGKDGAMCVGGQFGVIDGVEANNVACWDGDVWAQSGDGLPGEVLRLHRHSDGTLYAAGTFTFITDPNTGAYIAGMGRYDAVKKVWVPFEGVDGGFINTVRVLATESGGGLLIGGVFNQVGSGATGAAAKNMARFKGGAWGELGGGITAAVGAFNPAATGAYEMIVSDEGVYVAGFFSEVGGKPSISVARIDKSGAAVPLTADLKMHQGIDGFVDTVIADSKGRVVVGGGFRHAGPVEASGVARWLGDGWEPLGKGIDGVVRVLQEDPQGVLWAGGEMFLKGPEKIAAVARFEGGEWKVAGKGLNGPVFAIAPDSTGRILIGGDFTANEDGVQLGYVAGWNGSDWASVGAGFDGRVTSLVRGPDGLVYAGGLFAVIGSEQKTRGVAVLDGDQWKPLGGGLDVDFDYISALAFDGQGRLIVGGQFTMIGGKKITSLARWNGTSFEAIGEPLSSGFDGMTPLVSTVFPAGPGMFVGGIFSKAGTTPLEAIGWQGPGGWKGLGGGLGDVPEEMVVAGGALWVGGPFVTAGGAPSHGVARFDFAQ